MKTLTNEKGNWSHKPIQKSNEFPLQLYYPNKIAHGRDEVQMKTRKEREREERERNIFSLVTRTSLFPYLGKKKERLRDLSKY